MVKVSLNAKTMFQCPVQVRLQKRTLFSYGNMPSVSTFGQVSLTLELPHAIFGLDPNWRQSSGPRVHGNLLPREATSWHLERRCPHSYLGPEILGKWDYLGSNVICPLNLFPVWTFRVDNWLVGIFEKLVWLFGGLEKSFNMSTSVPIVKEFPLRLITSLYYVLFSFTSLILSCWTGIDRQSIDSVLTLLDNKMAHNGSCLLCLFDYHFSMVKTCLGSDRVPISGMVVKDQNWKLSSL